MIQQFSTEYKNSLIEKHDELVKNTLTQLRNDMYQEVLRECKITQKVFYSNEELLDFSKCEKEKSKYGNIINKLSIRNGHNNNGEKKVKNVTIFEMLENIDDIKLDTRHMDQSEKNNNQKGSFGMKRRHVVINFLTKFVKNPVLPNEVLIDTNLKHMITIEKMFILEFLEILIDHFGLYLKDKMDNPPERFKSDTSVFVKNNDPIGEWLDSNVMLTKNYLDVISATDFYDNFIDFMNGEKIFNHNSFKNALFMLGIEQKRKSAGNFYIFVKFKK
jgi:hypothetical protein